MPVLVGTGAGVARGNSRRADRRALAQCVEETAIPIRRSLGSVCHTAAPFLLKRFRRLYGAARKRRAIAGNVALYLALLSAIHHARGRLQVDTLEHRYCADRGLFAEYITLL